MLPFLKSKNDRSVGLSISTVRKPEGGMQDEEGPETKENYGLKSCAEELLRAIEAKDADKVAQTLKDAFDILENQPHDEAEPEGDSE